MRIIRTLLLALGISAGFMMVPEGYAAAAEKKESAVGFYLDTVITLTAYTEDASVLYDALEECGRYEQLLSRTIEGSDVWRLNHAGGEPVEVSPETLQILEAAGEISGLSGGAFDITIAPASLLWDFTSGEAKLPEADALREAAALVDYKKVLI